MKKHIADNLLLCFVLPVVLASCITAEHKQKNDILLSIIPQPKEVQVYEGFFFLDETTLIMPTSEEQGKVAILFNKELKKLFGLSCRIANTPVERNVILMSQDNSLSEEAYCLDISDSKITIRASSESGYFYAFQTILQLIPVTKKKSDRSEIMLNQLTVADQPRFEWRGALLDISRHFFGPSKIKKLIDQMAVHKMNRLHLHLTDDPGWLIEIEEYPKLH